MRAVIIDDESKCRQTLGNLIKRFADNINVVGEANCVSQGVKLIDTEKPDLVFLDIQMPDGTGFDLLNQIEFNTFKLIFCTSYDQYAVKAFRFSAIDYLLKPLDPDIFVGAMNKLNENEQAQLQSKLEVLSSNTNDFSRIALHSADGINLVDIADIIRCESNGNYTRFVIKNKPNILVTKTMKEYDEILSTQNFIRIHKSYLVNLAHITKYVKGEGGWVIMTDGSKIEVARRKKDLLMNILSKI